MRRQPLAELPRILESHDIRLQNLRPRKTGVSKEKLWKVLEFENSRFFTRSWKAVGEMEKNNAAGDPGRGSCRNYRSAIIAYFIVLLHCYISVGDKSC